MKTSLIHVLATFSLEKDPKSPGMKYERNNILTNLVYKWIHLYPNCSPLILGQSLTSVSKNFEDDL